MQRAIVLAALITPTHSSFIIKLHILIAPVELSHFTVWIFNGREVEVEWLVLFFFIFHKHLQLLMT